MLEQVRPLIEQALVYADGKDTWDGIATELREGRAFLMISESGKSVAVLQPVHSLHFWAAAGVMQEVLAIEAEATRRAVPAGFDMMTLRGRDGWERKLISRGWKADHGLVKDL